MSSCLSLWLRFIRIAERASVLVEGLPHQCCPEVGCGEPSSLTNRHLDLLECLKHGRLIVAANEFANDLGHQSRMKESTGEESCLFVGVKPGAVLCLLSAPRNEDPFTSAARLGGDQALTFKPHPSFHESCLDATAV